MEVTSLNHIEKCYFGSDNKTNKDVFPRNNAINSELETDIFVSSNILPSKSGGVFGKVFGKVRDIATQVSETVNNLEVKQKLNAVKLTKLFVENGTFTSYNEAYKNKELINELAKLDYEQIVKKYNAVLNNLSMDGVKKDTSKYIQTMAFGHIYSVLSFDKLDAEDIDAIYSISRARVNDSSYNDNHIDLGFFVHTLKNHENFDNLSASAQKSYMRANSYDFPTYNTLMVEEAKNLPKTSSLLKFDYVRDLRTVNSKEEFVQNLDERRRNIPNKAIYTDNEKIKKVLSKDGIENLSYALSNTDITKYEKGFPLEYSRNEFIKDFNNLLRGLSNEDKKKVFEYFGFKINSANDIINYPNPNTTGEIDDSLKRVVSEAQKYVNKFTFENRVKLDKEDKDLETELNNIIQAFPEFISVIGKIQHRGDSIDYHTMDDMKRILNDKDFKTLPDTEKRILTIATLFHDFGKIQREVDNGHAKKSAILTKEILKKTELSYDEKERIFNLINHSHWLVDGSSNEDIAFDFRRPNDFKMAEIFERADSNSSGFKYCPNPEKISQIKNNIEKINQTGIPLFVNQLPKEDKYYDKTTSGIRYLDLRDPEMSVEKYGYPKGTKVKDLKFLCHSSSDDSSDFEAICDDSKEVCLSTSLLDYRTKFSTGYNSEGAYIVSGNNTNIVIGGKNVSCTGGHRGREYAKRAMYLEETQKGFLSNNSQRLIIPNQIKEKLNLSDVEYSELYKNICNLENLEDVPDVILKNGRTIKAEDIKQTISDIQSELVRPRTENEKGYTNEIVVYNPKIEARVLRNFTPERLNRSPYTDEIYVLV